MIKSRSFHKNRGEKKYEIISIVIIVCIAMSQQRTCGFPFQLDSMGNILAILVSKKERKNIFFRPN